MNALKRPQDFWTKCRAKDFWMKVDFGKDDNDCWNWTGSKNNKGYGRFYLKNDTGKTQYAHRVSWFFEYGEFPTQDLLHKCDNPSCVNPKHLHEGGASENAKEAYSRNRGKQKLTPQHVLAIRKWQGTRQEAAEMFGVSYSTITDILLGRRWAWVK